MSALEQRRAVRGFCSLLSKELGEDPIGCVRPSDQFLVIEGALPWPGSFTEFGALLSEELIAYLIERIDAGDRIMPLFVAPDQQYSRPGITRVMHFRRPAEPFRVLEREEYVVPSGEVTPLVQALVERQSARARYQAFRQHTDHPRDMLVCTHGSVDAACAKFGFPLYLALHCRYAQPQGSNLRVWRVSHFGGHRFAPTLIDLPSGRYWGHLRHDLLDALVLRRGEVSDLRHCYRGWGGLETVYEHVAERDAWMHEGWRWLDYKIAAETVRADDERGWGEVLLRFAREDGSDGGVYYVTVEQSGTLLVQESSDSAERVEAKQYQVSRIERIS